MPRNDIQHFACQIRNEGAQGDKKIPREHIEIVAQALKERR